MKRREKKSETLDIRLPHEQKQAFMSATRAQGETASQALRRYIATYIEEARVAEHTTPVQEITMTLLRHRIKTAVTASAAALSIFVFSAMPSAATPSTFEKLDKNKDGMITKGEIMPGHDADIIAKLDTDKSGGISREELEAADNRIVIKKTSIEKGKDGQSITKERIKVLRFAYEGSVADTEDIGEKRIILKLTGGKELSQEELDALVADAMKDVDIDGEFDIDINVDALPKE